MKISEMIETLSGYMEAYGDIEVTCKETLTPTTRDKLDIIDGAAFETTATVFYTERTEAFPYPHVRITL